MITLNKEQQKCVEHLDGNVLIMAGAGSGKTRVIIERFLAHVKQGVHPDRILCVTFTNKAAKELVARLEKADFNVGGLWVGTIHKICFMLLQKYGDLNNNVSIIDQEDQIKIASKLCISDYIVQIQKYKENIDIEKTAGFDVAYKKYQAFLEDNNFIDFGEILHKTFSLLQNNPEIKHYFQYLIVDEYQDTNSIQNEIFKLLENNNLCCVGDDDQSIYGWRGADVTNILNFEQTFSNVSVFKLQQNYRCNKHILALGKHVIKQNHHRLQKDVFSLKEGPKVKMTYVTHEGDFIARNILNLPKTSTTAILFRNSKHLQQIEQSLIKFDINYKILHKIDFLNRLEIKIAIAYLKTVFFNDILALEKMINTPRRGVGPKTFQKILDQMNCGLSLESALRENRQGGLANDIQRWKNLTSLPIIDIFNIIWAESGCAELFQDREENINLFKNKLKNFNSIKDFLDSCLLFEDFSDENISPVMLMTIHGAKGLEFDNVFIPQFLEGVLPSIQSIKTGNVDEERRIAYVAITRAKENLFISYNLRQSGGFQSMFGPSRFLFNSPTEHIDISSE